MSDQEMNKKMEFIVEHQAKFAADIQIMREVQAADSKRLSDGLIGVVDIVGGLARFQMKTDETVNLLAEEVGRLTQAQAQTEASLKILINVVERKLGGNGGAESSA